MTPEIQKILDRIKTTEEKTPEEDREKEAKNATRELVQALCFYHRAYGFKLLAVAVTCLVAEMSRIAVQEIENKSDEK